MLKRSMGVGQETVIDGNIRIVFLGWANSERTAANIGFDVPRDVPITWDGKGERGASVAITRDGKGVSKAPLRKYV